MKADLSPDYSQLQLALSRIGYFRRGTLLKRLMTCGKPGLCLQGLTPSSARSLLSVDPQSRRQDSHRPSVS